MALSLSRCIVAMALAASASIPSRAAFLTFEFAGATAAAITPTRDAFRVAVGGGAAAGANGSFGGLRREINWDGVPDARADPNALPADFFNVTSPRGVVFSTPGTGFLVSANAGQVTSTLFGFPSDFQTFSAQRLFTAVNSNITDVSFFLPGTTTQATTNAFGLIFSGVEVAALTQLDFFDLNGLLIYSRDALASGKLGLSFAGAVANAGEQIARVRITSGQNTLVSNGVKGNSTDDLVVMDDFPYAEPLVAATAVSEPGSLVLVAFALLAFGGAHRLRRRVAHAG